MIIGQFCETYPPALDGVGRVMLAYCQTLPRMGHRCLYIAPRDAAATSVPGLETLLYPSMPIPGEPYRVGIPALGRDFRRAARSVPFDVVHAHTPFLAERARARAAQAGRRDAECARTRGAPHRAQAQDSAGRDLSQQVLRGFLPRHPFPDAVAVGAEIRGVVLQHLRRGVGRQ